MENKILLPLFVMDSGCPQSVKLVASKGWHETLISASSMGQYKEKSALLK
jgi:hypothetical protein